MKPETDRPPLMVVAEVIVGNVLPVVGVILLGWPAVTVVSLYVLDVWLCILGLGASVMIRNRAELREMIPKKYGRTRGFFFLAVAVLAVEAILSSFAVVPGIMVLAHMGGSGGLPFAEAFHGADVWISIALLVGSHVARIARSVRGEGEGVLALDPKMQMAFYAGRMALMMALAWLAAPGFLSRFLVPVYVAGVAALFTYSDLYPRRFLARVDPRAARGSREAPAGPGNRKVQD